MLRNGLWSVGVVAILKFLSCEMCDARRTPTRGAQTPSFAATHEFGGSVWIM